MNDNKKTYPVMLSIAGSDPSGGAGIQADIKAGSACGCFVATAIVAVVDENTCGVYGVHPIPVDFVTGQIRSVIDDLGVNAVKIGMLHSSELILAVRDTLKPYHIPHIVLDPVMVATSGDPLLLPDAIDTLREHLLPMASVITPNIPEATLLLGHEFGHDTPSLIGAARELAQTGRTSVYLKAGHISGTDTLTDVLYDVTTDTCHTFSGPKVNTPNTHGTGCTLSSSIASFLARGFALPDACRLAHDYLAAAINAGASFRIGKGHGPVNHFYNFWK